MSREEIAGILWLVSVGLAITGFILGVLVIKRLDKARAMEKAEETRKLEREAKMASEIEREDRSNDGGHG